ncbi:MAG: hypothetical protein HYY42_04465 [Chloroflexi bacterium]|nr:hypothetical protein [Chloroflexota bacterium]
MLRRHLGFSVWATKRRAVDAAVRYPELRKRFPFVAEIELPDEARLEPFSDVPDHLTAFGDPDVFVVSVIAVEPVNLDHE